VPRTGDAPRAGGVRIFYNDARRFGFMVLTDESGLDSHPLLRHLGIEPLSPALDGARLIAAFRGRSTSLKAALMDQRLVAGLGNIYVCEALWRARLSPLRSAGTIATRAGSARAEALARAIRAVLEEAVAAGGSTLRDYRQADGRTGGFQERFAVYDRADEPCFHEHCRGAIRRIAQNGRSTFYCPECQR
jgi:formamidopyrimidine-DNA glycosylase